MSAFPGRRPEIEQDLVAVDLETTGFDAETETIIEIGAVRLRVGEHGRVVAGERFRTFVDPGRPLSGAIRRLTGIRDEDLAGAPAVADAIAAFAAFARDAAILGHNVGFDLAFLERAGFPAGAARLDTADLASSLLPTAPSYALQRLAAEAGIVPDAAHRALDDALTCAAVLEWLGARARALPPDILFEAQSYATVLGAASVAFFDGALADASWPASPAPSGPAGPGGTMRADAFQISVARAFGADGPLAAAIAHYEDRREQRELALAIERTLASGGVLVAEAGTGVGKSLAYAVPAIGAALRGERVIVSTHTLPLQDQLVRKDLPALQEALGTDVAVAVLKGRSNYLCPRRWQAFRSAVTTREEARLALKTLVWRTSTVSGDRAELNLLGGESALWARVSAEDEGCEARRCARVAGGCYLERARQAVSRAGIVVVNHALLLQDARMRNALLPESVHVVVDEAHHLEEAATSAFGLELVDAELRRALDRVARAPAVLAALRDEARAPVAETLRREVESSLSRAGELFAALADLLPGREGAARLRVTGGLRASDEQWLPVELAGERLADALAAVAGEAERIASGADTDDQDPADELRSAAAQLGGPRAAIARGVHAPRPEDIVWLAREEGSAACALRVAPAHVGEAIRRSVVDPRRSAVFTSATLAVAGSVQFALERFGVSDIADTLVVGSPFDFASQAALLIPEDIALPHEEQHGADVASVVSEIARAIGGRTLVLFTSHSSLRDVSARLGHLEDAGLAVLTQGVDGSRRAILERFSAGGAVLLGTQSFWEGVDLPGELLRCVVVAKLPFAVPDDPLVEGRAERYEDPFREFHLPNAALRLRQGFGRLIRSKTDRGAVVICDKRLLTKEYGPTLLASLPPAKLHRVPLEGLATVVAEWCGRSFPSGDGENVDG